MIRARSIAVVCISILALAACGPAVKPGAPRYDLRECRKVELIDAETGAAVIGAEDLRVDAARMRLIVSAYDRRAVESAARSGAAAVPEGGVYAVDLGDLATKRRASARALVDRAAITGGVRPQGLYVDEKTGELAFINRGYAREHGRWTQKPQVIVADEAGGVVSATPTRCAANAVVMAPTLLTTYDHRSCDWRAGFEDLFGGGGTGVVNAAGRSVFKGARFANGLAGFGDATLALAATRERAVLILAPAGDGTFVRTRRIPTPGGPDNVTVNEQGALVAAVHPSLWRLGLERRLGIGRAPSRVVEIDIATGRSRLLLDDPAGRTMSAVTAAVEHQGMLYAGSAVDRGVLVCEGPRE